jgi:hypothetical protein
MAEGSWYNGYSAKERTDKLKAYKIGLANGNLRRAHGPCDLCNDPEVAVEYIWQSPAMFSLCRNCHRDKLHKRFWRHSAWIAFLAHVRRGGYARDLGNPEVKRELQRFREALERGETLLLKELRPYPHKIGEEWFSNLRLDPESLEDASSRPRPYTNIGPPTCAHLHLSKHSRR